MSGLLIERARHLDGRLCDVRIRAGRIAELAPRLEPTIAERRIDAHGGALVPGLYDHHIHLLAQAAALDSIRCGPPDVCDEAGLRSLLEKSCRSGSESDWIRAIGYHESVAGALDRWRLDAWTGDRPLRLQHQSGALWMLNSAALARLDLESSQTPEGAERGADGELSGRFFRLDDWLGERLGERGGAARLAEVGRSLARLGVVGLCDASVGNAGRRLRRLCQAVATGELPQRLLLMSPDAQLPLPHDRLRLGPCKIVLDDARLPDPDALADRIARTHAAARAVALHCVTRAELVLAASALSSAGRREGDRIEHASVTAPDLMRWLARLRVRVVTQPAFLFDRGDRYLREVDPRDRPWLYRGRGFLEASVRLAAGSDAPFGPLDPWLAMRSAVERRSRAGACLAPQEALSPEQALALFSSPLETPGAPPSRLAVGLLADLCLLDRPWSEAREFLHADCVRASLCAGEIVWSRDDPG